MSSPVLCSYSSAADLNISKEAVIRSTVNFHRSIWGDRFLTYNEREDQAWEEQQAKELTEEVRKELVLTGSNGQMQHVKMIQLIDAIQRLGVAYHFEEEIEDTLKHIYVTYGDHWIDDSNLESTSVWFRLLRQQGFNVSSGIFKKYMDSKGNFMESELSQISKWWKNLDLQNKLPYVRDRLVEGYFWILAVYFEPQYSDARIFLMKTCNLVIILDDTYDNYGTYEELEIFTEAVQRWSASCIDTLPEYMKSIYQELLDVHKEAEEVLERKGKAYHSYYTKEMVKELMDDIATHEEEQERNHVASSIECYMKQYGVSEEQTREIFSKQVEDAWKVVNQESLRPTAMPRPLLMPPINLARVCDVLYKHGDDYNHAGKEMINIIESLLAKPINVSV
ncbi:hypothetical protein L2E82_49603 [Cichorium intybus]|uniref:Uncharacterized protein n=1 Tax=Cichorium intybus TaxID=13427 RepID=A0ACB8Z147_CICIN|nr:hypothetical protein L2E82_49603 [Cichorium intybus]